MPRSRPFDADAARADALSAFLNQHASEGVQLLASPTMPARIEVIPTGAISVDVALGVGGFPKGRIVELYGPEGGGKSTLALSAAVQCQAAGGCVALVDAENAFSLEYAAALGVDPERFVVYQPTSGEDGVTMVEKMVESGAFDLVIVDSVAALVPLAELEADMEQQHMGLHARLMSKFMRRVTGPVGEKNVCLLLINQVRTNLASYGAPEQSTGGKAIKFYASVRVEVRSSASKKIERDKRIVGQTVTVKVTKNRLGPPYRVATFDLIFGVGVEGSGSLLEVAETCGVVVRSGASYTEVATGERLAVGKENVKARIEAEPDLAARLTEAVYASLGASAHTGRDSDAEVVELVAAGSDQ